jgi:thiamine pyrophosphokinase
MAIKKEHPSPVRRRRDVLRIVIFSNGKFEHAEQDRNHIQPGDILIAADGGLHHCLALELTPDLLVGDLDSVDPELVSMLREHGTEIHEHPTRKDHTDLELALEVAVEHEADEILIIGGLGGRWDQTLANILLLTQLRFQGPNIQLIDGPQRIQYLPAGTSLEISGKPGTIVSLVPIKGTAKGITTDGLEYELAHGALEYGSSQGISNVLVKDRASVKVEEGALICIDIDADYED